MPPVFWEIHDGREEVCLTLHRLTADLDAGPILLQRAVPIQWRDSLGDTITATRQAAGREIAAFLSDSLHDIVDGRVDANALGTGPVRTIPRFRDVLKAQRICRDRARIRSS
jgi:methionyl-tRNA formyltransferase